MAKKIISYKINQDGTIPDYVEDGGYLPKHFGSIFEATFIGVSKNGANISEAEAEFADETSLNTYVNTYMSDLVMTNPLTKEEHLFNSVPVVSSLFAKIA